MRLCSIASGSSGNCIYAGSDATHILIDAGISGKRIDGALAELELCGRDIDGILITHEHADHIQGLGVLTRKYQIPIYCTEGTRNAILSDSRVGKIEENLFQTISEDEKFILKDLVIHPIRISHDAAQPVAYRVGYGKQHVAVMTDLGVYDDYIVESLKGVDALILEANHDVNMLQVGPYPYYLKQRILGKKGHLSNEASGRLLCEILHDDIQAIMLGHLSKENNLPELAYESVRMEITMADIPYNGSDFPLYVAKRSEMTQPILVK